MTETMLVRAAGGGWETLQSQTSIPEGGIVEVFGDDIGPVLGASSSVIVAACAPARSTGMPDALCVDPGGGIWIVQLALDGSGAQALPQLLEFGGALNGMSYATFEETCTQRGDTPLAEFVEARTGSAAFRRDSFETAITDALANGRFRLVAMVREAAPALVQSMRFLNSTGAMCHVYEATSFASASVSAIRASAVDVGRALGSLVPVASRSERAPVDAAAAQPAAPPLSGGMGAAAFLAATGASTDEPTSALMAKLHASCEETFDEMHFEGDAAGATMRAIVGTGTGEAAMLAAGSDGSVVVSFEALGELDAAWSVRSELCQGMERLLGTDLGEVRKISQLNLSIAEHLMDATLMEALAELLADTVQALHAAAEPGARTGARQPTAA